MSRRRSRGEGSERGRGNTDRRNPDRRSPDRPDDPDRIGSLVDPLLRKLGIAEEVARQDVLARWEQVVGERIAKVTRATAVDGEVLFVEVATSAWLNELNLLRRDILARLNAGRREGRVERLVFRLSERPEPGRRDD